MKLSETETLFFTQVQSNLLPEKALTQNSRKTQSKLSRIWVNLLWRRISHKRKGGRLVYRELFSLKQLLAFLLQAVDRDYQVVEAIYVPSS